MTLGARLKAEMVLAVQLAARHRAVRLTALLALAGLVLARASDPLPALLLTACGLGATAASRPLAPGAAMHLAARGAEHPLVVTAGRLGGVLLLLLGATAAALPVVALDGFAAQAWQQIGVALVAGAAVAACVLGLAPVVGASGAGGLGLLAAVFGLLPPTAVARLLDGLAPVRDGVVLAWNVLPLPWRAERWLLEGRWTDGVLLAGWIAGGIAATAWVLVPPRRAGAAT